jgi:hypothetical protein
LLLGGVIGDGIMKRRDDGRLVVAAFSLLTSVPRILLALGRPAGHVQSFALLTSAGVAFMYVYYAPAILDVIEPSLRGTAMSIYFFAMYVLKRLSLACE